MPKDMPKDLPKNVPQKGEREVVSRREVAYDVPQKGELGYFKERRVGWQVKGSISKEGGSWRDEWVVMPKDIPQKGGRRIATSTRGDG